mmetsp:Transcript_69867/g.220550  ORF Transcript_69867/g.220550 Transcript_69867/m.220550 type:complete len:240 (+) Transcript_69867:1850-2569(+)
MQSSAITSQGRVLHSRISARPPSQGLPPCSERPRIARARLRQPPPQDLPHLSHMPQDESLQSTGSCALHCSVSCSAAPHGRPSKEGCSTTERRRCLCPTWPFIRQSPQAVHSESAQSLRLGFGNRQRLVSARGPAQGWPHSLLVTLMLRVLSQRPAAEGFSHSAQAAKTQSRGLQGALHAVDAEHLLTLSWAPWQWEPPEAAKRKSFGARRMLRARLLIMVRPHPPSQPLGADHSVQAQ